MPAVPTAAGVQTHRDRDARQVALITRRAAPRWPEVPPSAGAAVVTVRSAA
jgi:hypothetical protein